ncbi:MAG: hypothetical protein ACD_63C00006G0001 [uncultured bacterium]|nr:MAG: hypothetical protein ACD_63C00006G0001 [uncultured bacterium]
MECERLQRLVKAWYAQVRDEAMAPARMVTFMQSHIAECHACLADPHVRKEIDKITEIILPPSKARPSTKDKDGELEEYEEVVEENTGVESETDDSVLDDDEIEEVEDEDDLDDI